MRLGHFDPPGPLQRIAPSSLCGAAAATTAREGSAQGAALFKNAHGTLPLRASTIRSIAVIGPNANLSQAIAGYYGPSRVCGGRYTTMIDAIASYVPHASITHAAGVPSVLSDDTSGVAAAAGLARAAQTTVLVLGTDLSVARENLDAVNLTYARGQLALVAAVAAASATPVTIVTFTAVPLDLTPFLAHPNIGAIVHAGQPSIQTGGVAEVLFGGRSPSGRAVQTIYPASYQHNVSIFDFGMRPGPSRWPRPDSPGPCNDPYKRPVVPSPNCTLGTNPGRTYRFFNGQAVIPFGYGLSYTTWSYDVVGAPDRVSLAPTRALLRRTAERAAATESQYGDAGSGPGPGVGASSRLPGSAFPRLAEAGVAAQYVVNVTNTGSVDADDVVLGFISPPGAGTGGRPLKVLFGFERVHVKAGETASVFLYPALTDLTTTTADGAREPLAGEYRVSFGVRPTGQWGAVDAGRGRMGHAEVALVAF